MSISQITSKGQITIPLEVRKRLGLKKGDRLEFVIQGKQTVIRPARAAANPFQAYAGALKSPSSREEINRWVSDLRDDDES
jgi:antitoxin PrlF